LPPPALASRPAGDRRASGSNATSGHWSPFCVGRLPSRRPLLPTHPLPFVLAARLPPAPPHRCGWRNSNRCARRAHMMGDDDEFSGRVAVAAPGVVAVAAGTTTNEQRASGRGHKRRRQQLGYSYTGSSGMTRRQSVPAVDEQALWRAGGSARKEGLVARRQCSSKQQGVAPAAGERGAAAEWSKTREARGQKQRTVFHAKTRQRCWWEGACAVHGWSWGSKFLVARPRKPRRESLQGGGEVSERHWASSPLHSPTLSDVLPPDNSAAAADRVHCPPRALVNSTHGHNPPKTTPLQPCVKDRHRPTHPPTPLVRLFPPLSVPALPVLAADPAPAPACTSAAETQSAAPHATPRRHRRTAGLAPARQEVVPYTCFDQEGCRHPALWAGADCEVVVAAVHPGGSTTPTTPTNPLKDNWGARGG
jgi:hypothetical protein